MKKRILTLVIAFVMSFTFFAGCADSASNSDYLAGVNATTQATDSRRDESYYPDVRTKTDGIHIQTAPETEKYMVKDGVSDYFIVIPQGASSIINTAKDEFKTLFLEATGYNLPVIVESGEGLTHNPDAKYISIGDTKLLESARATTDAELSAERSFLTTSGVRIVTVDNTIYIFGTHDYGPLSGVYIFMEICFNFDIYYYDTWDIDTGVINMKLRNFDVTEIADIEFRGTGYGWIRQNRENNILYRSRAYAQSYGGLFFPSFSQPGCQGGSTSIHNTDELINGYTPGYNKDWVSDNGNQLCYTSHGNPDTYQGLVEAIAIKQIEGYVYTADNAGGADKIAPWKRYFAITIEDNAQTCTCPSCYASEVKYGERVAAAVMLANDVMSYIVDYWMNTEEGLPYKRDDLYQSIFAYHEYVNAPAQWDANSGKYVVNHPDIQPRDDFSIFFCFSGTHNRNNDFYAVENEHMRTNYLKWGDICKDMIIWAYQTNFTSFMELSNTWEFYDQDAYGFIAASPVSFCFNQTQGSDMDATNFNAFKAYLEYKYYWDSTYDYETLKQKFHKAMYREAADIMMEYMDYSSWYYNNFLLRMNWRDKRPQSNKQQYHPLAEIRKRMEYCDRAIELIESIYAESNPEICEKIKFHIGLEWIAPAYQMLAYYSTDYVPQDEWNAVTNRMRELGKVIGTMNCSEGDGGALSKFMKNL